MKLIRQFPVAFNSDTVHYIHIHTYSIRHYDSNTYDRAYVVPGRGGYSLIWAILGRAAGQGVFVSAAFIMHADA